MDSLNNAMDTEFLLADTSHCHSVVHRGNSDQLRAHYATFTTALGLDINWLIHDKIAKSRRNRIDSETVWLQVTHSHLTDYFMCLILSAFCFSWPSPEGLKPEPWNEKSRGGFTKWRVANPSHRHIAPRGRICDVSLAAGSGRRRPGRLTFCYILDTNFSKWAMAHHLILFPESFTVFLLHTNSPWYRTQRLWYFWHVETE